ncbi:MAG: glycosyltransferase family 39 protein, partial [Anaerolineae bacterium]|nr:glycosyltransferase family 39 protein [Anaerolineae bacterium]
MSAPPIPRRLVDALHTPAAAQIAALVVLVLAAGLRFHLLDAQSLWNDEGASVVMAGRTVGEILSNAAADIHPPGYYLLLAGWTRLAGTSEFALRALSALASVLTVACAIALACRLFGRPAGWLAGLLLALSTVAIYYAQETRMYALLGLLATAALWVLVEWTTRTERQAGHPLRWLITLVLLNTAGLYTHYAYPFTMIAQGLIFVLWWLRRRDRRALGQYVAANALTLLLFAPWAGEAIRQVTTWPNNSAGADPATVLNKVALGLTVHYGVNLLAAAAQAGALVLAANGLWRARDPLRATPQIWAGITVGAFLLLGLRADDLKQLTPAAAAVAIWLGGGAAYLWRTGCFGWRAVAVAAMLALAITLLGGLPPLYGDPAYARADYRALAARIEADARPGDAVILDGPGQGEVWAYYYTGDAPVYPLPRGLGGDDEATRAELATILDQHRRIYALYWGVDERD